MTLLPIKQFRSWRKAMGLKQKEAANCLGSIKRVIQYYEGGQRDGKKVKVPKAVELASHAIAHGVDAYDGTVVDSEASTTSPW